MTVEGIDVSLYQPTTPSLVGRRFLFARASIGTRTDDKYAMHIRNAKAAGLVTGAYHFGDNRIAAATQAAVFLKAAGDVDFYFLDVEGSNAMGSAAIRAFFAAVRTAGQKVGLYHSLSGFPELGQDYNWVAYWSGVPPSINWTFWQYRGSPLDLDRFIGTLAQLRTLADPTPSTHRKGVIKTATALYNPKTRKWVYKGANKRKPPTKLELLPAAHTVGGVSCYRITSGSWSTLYAGYFVPRANVTLGGLVT